MSDHAPPDDTGLERRARAAVSAGDVAGALAAIAAWRSAAPDAAAPPALAALVHLRRGATAEAEAALGDALARDPRHAALWRHRARIAAATGRAEAARAALLRAVALAPDDPGTWQATAHLAEETDARPRAVFALRVAARLAPEPVTLRLLAETLRLLDRPEESERRAVQSLALAPDAPETVAVLAQLLTDRLAHAAALRLLQAALRAAPHQARLWARMGDAVIAALDRYGAIRAYRRALALAPTDADTHVSMSLRLLNLGVFAAGWAHWEWRLRLPQTGMRRWRRHRRPRWNGTAQPDLTVLVWPEQGVGDEIQLASCLPAAGQRVGRLIVECDQRLVGLFARSFPGIGVHAERLGREGATVENTVPHDAQVAMGSLPVLLRRKLSDFVPQAHYLVADPVAVQRWRQTLLGLGPRPKVGLSWRSGLLNARRARYMATLQDLAPILDTPDVTWINLQYDECEAELVAAERRQGIVIHRPTLDQKNDLDGVAALMSALDLVISVPTTVAVLAGALGTPTWAFHGPPTHHCYFGTERWPYVPAVRPYCRTRWTEPWDDLMERIAADLAELVSLPR